MGLFGDIAHFITGGGAQVNLSVGDPGLDRPFPVTVHVTVGDAECRIKRVYINIIGEEIVRVHNVDVARRGANDTVEVFRETVTGTTTGTDMNYDIAPAQTLAANSTHEFTAQLMLPNNALPTYHGLNAEYRWRALAGLEVSGNDPDSGWQDLDIH